MQAEVVSDVTPLATVGVLADTHIPDRMFNLHPAIVPAFREAKVDLILHAGDICAAAVLQELEDVAPVRAVRGNRDMFIGRLNHTERIEIASTCVAMTHGHGNLFRYAIQKMRYLLYGYRIEHYLPLLIKSLPEARVIIFGHTHKPMCIQFGETMVFNPGSAGMGWMEEIRPSIGLLYFYGNDEVEGRIVYLEGGVKREMKWHSSVSM